MIDAEFQTLAYTKSPKVSRRTTFQDELETAVSARASKLSKTKTDRYSFMDDFNDDEDDFLNELLRSRKKKTEAFKAGRNKATVNDFELSDDEVSSSRPKRVSFLKTKRISLPSQHIASSDLGDSEQPYSPIQSGPSQNNSFQSQRSTSLKNTKSSDLSQQISEGSPIDTPLPVPSENHGLETLGSSEEGNKSGSGDGRKSLTPKSSGSGLMHKPSTDSIAEKEPPRPRPRQRTLGLNFHTAEEQVKDSGSPLRRTNTYSMSIPLSCDTADNTTLSSTDGLTRQDSSPHGSKEDHPVSCDHSKSSSLIEQSLSVTRSTIDSGTRENLNSDESKEHEGKYSTSFEEFHEESENQLDSGGLSNSNEKSLDTRPSSSLTKRSQRSRSVCSSKVEAKYMGSLKVLDRKVSLEQSQPEAADSLRAAIYQEWLKKKKVKLREAMQLKREEMLKEEKRKKDEQAKKDDAMASYAAWKEIKMQTFKTKSKEKEDLIRKQQKALEEKKEKRESAKKVFETWKKEQDEVLKEKYRKQREVEKKLKQKNQEKEEERKRDSQSVLSNWDEKKKSVLTEKAKIERNKKDIKAEEERNNKEERDKMALEMYEKWITRKERECRRQREERQIQAILQDSPPPPWSPPNKTVPFRK